MKSYWRYLLPLLTLATLGCAAPARADRAGQARVSALEGDLLVKGPEDVEWSYLDQNGVVYDGDVVWADVESLAELEMEGGARLRLGPDTRLDLRQLPPGGDLRLTRGSVQVDLTRTEGEGARVRTPAAELTVRAGSLARIDLEANDRVRVAVSRGAVDVHPDRGSAQVVRAGQLLNIEPAGRVSALAFARGDWDAFDNWGNERVTAFANRSLPVGVTQYLPGVLELADYGSWVDYDGGRYWRPRRVAADWRPYWNGYWGWGRGVPVWMPDDPWGYTTCHYGRWRWANSLGWLWSPTYAWGPAWVQWASFGDYLAWGPLSPFGQVAFRNRPWNVGSLAVDSLAWSFMPRQNFLRRDRGLVDGLNRAARRIPNFRLASLRPVRDFDAVGRDVWRAARFRGRQLTASAAGPAADRLRFLERRPLRAAPRIAETDVRAAQRRGERARAALTERVLGTREQQERGVPTPGSGPGVQPGHRTPPVSRPAQPPAARRTPPMQEGRRPAVTLPRPAPRSVTLPAPSTPGARRAPGTSTVGNRPRVTVPTPRASTAPAPRMGTAGTRARVTVPTPRPGTLPSPPQVLRGNERAAPPAQSVPRASYSPPSRTDGGRVQLRSAPAPRSSGLRAPVPAFDRGGREGGGSGGRRGP
jgi:hypothetical protein